MLNLSYVLELIVEGLDNAPFTQQNPIIHWSESAFHIVFQLGYQLYAVNEELAEKVPADISFVANQFAVDELHERFHFQRLAVIDISGCDHEIQNLALVVADQMQLEAVKPAEGTFAALCYPLEHLAHVDALVSADPEQYTVHKADSGTLPQQTLLDEDNKLYHN